jgi:tetratricopeptide (TPR) repeat protein
LQADLIGLRGILETSTNKLSDAVASFDEAIEQKTLVLGAEHLQLAKLHIEESVALRLMGKFKEALDHLEIAQNINNVFFKPDHLFFARISLEKGITYLEKKDYISAHTELEYAANNYEAKPNQDLREHVKACKALAQYYTNMNYPTLAQAQLNSAKLIEAKIH